MEVINHPLKEISIEISNLLGDRIKEPKLLKDLKNTLKKYQVDKTLTQDSLYLSVNNIWYKKYELELKNNRNLATELEITKNQLHLLKNLVKSETGDIPRKINPHFPDSIKSTNSKIQKENLKKLYRKSSSNPNLTSMTQNYSLNKKSLDLFCQKTNNLENKKLKAEKKKDLENLEIENKNLK